MSKEPTPSELFSGEVASAISQGFDGGNAAGGRRANTSLGLVSVKTSSSGDGGGGGVADGAPGATGSGGGGANGGPVSFDFNNELPSDDVRRQPWYAEWLSLIHI